MTTLVLALVAAVTYKAAGYASEPSAHSGLIAVAVVCAAIACLRLLRRASR